MPSEMRCSRCGDVVMHCECPYTDPAVVDDRVYYNSPSFKIYRGEEVVEWDSQRRSIPGDQPLLSEILQQLTGEYVEVLKPGFCLWMEYREPFAVHMVASEIEGCTFPIQPQTGDLFRSQALFADLTSSLLSSRGS